MSRLRSKALLIILQTLIVIGVSTSIPVAQKRKEKKQAPAGAAVLWRRPTDIASRDLVLGPGGPALQPDLRRITFLKEEKGGYSKKFRVRDASGQEWVVKIGKEAQSETAAVRLLWAIGYLTEINYLEPEVTIVGKGNFQNVRFEARPKSIKRLDEWKWKKNPFVDTREFQGLKVLMALINNWDMKDSNNKILLIRGDSANERRYIISDLGATFGKSSKTPIFWRITRSRNKPKDYAKAKFIDGVKNNYVRFHFGGKNTGLLKNITIEDAVWTGDLLSLLSPQQLEDAFRAANYSPADLSILVSELQSRIRDLVNLRGSQQMSRGR